MKLAASLSPLLLAAALAAETPARPPVTAIHQVELTDPAGDVSPIHSTGGDQPGFDVVKLAVRSDGARITVTATLKDPPGDFASDVVRLFFDTDANPATGAEFTYPKIRGFEYRGELNACVSYADRSEACAGGMSAKATGHWAAVELERYKGKAQFDTEGVVSALAFPGKKASPRTPIAGTRVESSFDYADLGVKPGQKIRLVVQESSGMSGADEGFFPEILLTLK